MQSEKLWPWSSTTHEFFHVLITYWHVYTCQHTPTFVPHNKTSAPHMYILQPNKDMNMHFRSTAMNTPNQRIWTKKGK